jgi:hypothetical protein
MGSGGECGPAEDFPAPYPRSIRGRTPPADTPGDCGNQRRAGRASLEKIRRLEPDRSGNHLMKRYTSFENFEPFPNFGEHLKNTQALFGFVGHDPSPHRETTLRNSPRRASSFKPPPSPPPALAQPPAEPQTEHSPTSTPQAPASSLHTTPVPPPSSASRA